MERPGPSLWSYLLHPVLGSLTIKWVDTGALQLSYHDRRRAWGSGVILCSPCEMHCSKGSGRFPNLNTRSHNRSRLLESSGISLVVWGTVRKTQFIQKHAQDCHLWSGGSLKAFPTHTSSESGSLIEKGPGITSPVVKMRPRKEQAACPRSQNNGGAAIWEQKLQVHPL